MDELREKIKKLFEGLKKRLDKNKDKKIQFSNLFDSAGNFIGGNIALYSLLFNSNVRGFDVSRSRGSRGRGSSRGSSRGGGRISGGKISSWQSTGYRYNNSTVSSYAKQLSNSSGGIGALAVIGGGSSNNQSKRGGYGRGAINFANVVHAHSNSDEIVNTFELNQEGSQYGDCYERAYREQYEIAQLELEETKEYYYGEVDMLTSEMNTMIDEAEELEEQAQALLDEAEELRDEAQMCEDPEEAEDLMSEAQDLEEEAQDLIEQANILRAQAEELQISIDEILTEVEMLDVEMFIDYDAVEENAYKYAIELADSWVDGEEWIPSDVLDWAWYDVSDHNNKK